MPIVTQKILRALAFGQKLMDFHFCVVSAHWGGKTVCNKNIQCGHLNNTGWFSCRNPHKLELGLEFAHLHRTGTDLCSRSFKLSLFARCQVLNKTHSVNSAIENVISWRLTGEKKHTPVAGELHTKEWKSTSCDSLYRLKRGKSLSLRTRLHVYKQKAYTKSFWYRVRGLEQNKLYL